MKKITKDSLITAVELPATEFGELKGRVVPDVYSLFRLPSRALHALDGVTKELGFLDVKIISPVYHGTKNKLDEKNKRRLEYSDAVLISSITRTSPQSMALGRKLKDSGKLVVAGGPDATFRAEEWLKKGAADIVVRGEGEITINELLLKLGDRTEGWKDVDGLAFMYGKEPYFTKSRKLMTSEEMGNLPHPFYDERVRKMSMFGVMETTRGCPNRCDYCGVSVFYGGKFRQKPIEYVLEGLADIRDMGRSVFFTDDNFSGDPKRTIRLLEAIDEYDFGEGKLLKNGGSAQASVAIAENPRVLDLMKKVGIDVLFIGLESLVDESLEDLGKPYSAKQNKEAIRTLRDRGFWVHGMFMPGGDGDTKEKLRESSAWINQNLDSVQFFSPIPVPGTRFASRMRDEGRILADVNDKAYLYDGQNVLVRPKHLTPYELQMITNNMYKSFYSAGNSARRLGSCSHKRIAAGILVYNLLGGLRRGLYNEQTREHLKFLKSIS